MTAWTVKKRFDFPSELASHINWESFVPLADIWGRLVIEKNFETGAMSVEAQAPVENKEVAPFPGCNCELCLVIRAKENERVEPEPA